MMVLLSFEQEDRVNRVGVFQSYENAVRFLESIPFLQKQQDEYGTIYFIPFAQLPETYTVRYNGWNYVLSRFSYSADASAGPVEAVLTPLCSLDSPPEEPDAPVDTDTLLDAYCYTNGDLEAAIEKRELFFKEAAHYFAEQGRKVEREGLGSEDGEYILVSEPGTSGSMTILAHLNPQVIDEWEKAGDFAAWLKKEQ